MDENSLSLRTSPRLTLCGFIQPQVSYLWSPVSLSMYFVLMTASCLFHYTDASNAEKVYGDVLCCNLVDHLWAPVHGLWILPNWWRLPLRWFGLSRVLLMQIEDSNWDLWICAPVYNFAQISVHGSITMFGNFFLVVTATCTQVTSLFT